MHTEAERLVARLDLAPHPEGGFYRELHRSEIQLPLARGPRAALTAIHFVLPAGAFSAFHRVRSEEAWCFLGGDALELVVLDEGGRLERSRLGPGLAEGTTPLAVVPADAWQAAEPLGERFSWCACLVAPGFDFADFELARRADLLARFPAQADLIQRLTHSAP